MSSLSLSSSDVLAVKYIMVSWLSSSPRSGVMAVPANFCILSRLFDCQARSLSCFDILAASSVVLAVSLRLCVVSVELAPHGRGMDIKIPTTLVK